ncbi:MAG TPA: DUF6134 family protein [Caulobacteraceae bacterium]
MNRISELRPLSRRDALAGVILVLATPRALLAAPSQLAFAALRNGQKIGEQRMSFHPEGEGLTAHTVVEMAVKLGPLTLYRYRHQATERWAGDRFESLETQTNANGKLLKVSARRTADGVKIMPAAGGVTDAPASALPFTHWNRKIATAPLFNPQDGKLLHETVVATPTKLSFRGDADIQDFYDEAGTWTGLIGKLADGSRLEYRPI